MLFVYAHVKSLLTKKKKKKEKKKNELNLKEYSLSSFFSFLSFPSNFQQNT